MTSWLRAILEHRGRSRSPRHTVRAFEPAWWHVMGFEDGPPRSLGNVEARFRQLAARVHPDRGGSEDHMQRLLRARASARRQLRGR